MLKFKILMVGEGGGGSGGGSPGGNGAGAPGASTPNPGGDLGAPLTGAGSSGKAPTQGAINSAKPTQGQAPGEEKTWDVPVDGKIVRMTEKEMKDAASLVKSSYKRFEEAAVSKKQTEAFWREFNENPMAALSKTKLTREQQRKFIEEYYKKEFIEQDGLTPEQKELAEAKKWRAEREAEDKARAEQAALEGRKKIEGQWRDHYSKAIMEGLEKSGKVPKTAKTVGRVAFYLQQNALQKIDQTLDQVIERVRQDYQEEHRAFVNDDTPVEALIELLGPNAVKKLQKYALEQYKRKQLENMGGVSPQVPDSPRRQNEPGNKVKDVNANGWGKVTNYWTRRDK